MGVYLLIFIPLKSQTKALQGSDEENQVKNKMMHDPDRPPCLLFLISIFFPCEICCFPLFCWAGLSNFCSEEESLRFPKSLARVLCLPAPMGMEEPELNISWGGKKWGVGEGKQEDLFIFSLISEPCYVLLLCKQEVWKASFPPVPVQGQLGA